MVRLYFASDLGGTPTFYVWLDGALFGTTTATFMDVPIGLDQIIQVDVFDSSSAVPDAVYPSTVILRCEGNDDTALYRIEQYVDSAWVVLEQIPATGNGLIRWESAPLEDSTTHTFRVVPVDGTARDGVAKEFAIKMCRYPDAPSATIAVASGEFTISN